MKISDIELIMLLRKNARMTYSELAKHFGVSDTAIRKRIKKLESEGVIRGYTVEVDPRKLGFNAVAIIGIDVKPEYYVSLIDELKNMKEIVSLYATTGDHMILAECWFRTSDDLARFVRKLREMEGVTRICPAIILEKIK